jgi:hypothetical protein
LLFLDLSNTAAFKNGGSIPTRDVLGRNELTLHPLAGECFSAPLWFAFVKAHSGMRSAFIIVIFFGQLA